MDLGQDVERVLGVVVLPLVVRHEKVDISAGHCNSWPSVASSALTSCCHTRIESQYCVTCVS